LKRGWAESQGGGNLRVGGMGKKAGGGGGSINSKTLSKGACQLDEPLGRPKGDGENNK